MAKAVESHYNQMPRFDFDEANSTSPLCPFEPFVDERVIAGFLQVTPRRVVEMARKGEIPAHPIGHARKTWRFRVSEVNSHFRSASEKQAGDNINSAVPGILGRKRLG